MTPLAPPPTPPPDPNVSVHAMNVLLSVIDFVVKLGTGLGAVWLGVTKIAKPYTAWRRAHYAELTKDVLGTELKQLAELRDNDTEVKDLCHEIKEGQEKILTRQGQMFREMNLFHEIAAINNERLDELNLFLDAIGFTSDRRSKSAEGYRKQVDELLVRLRSKKLARDRGDDPPDTDEHPIALEDGL